MTERCINVEVTILHGVKQSKIVAQKYSAVNAETEAARYPNRSRRERGGAISLYTPADSNSFGGIGLGSKAFEVFCPLLRRSLSS